MFSRPWPVVSLCLNCCSLQRKSPLIKDDNKTNQWGWILQISLAVCSFSTLSSTESPWGLLALSASGSTPALQPAMNPLWWRRPQVQAKSIVYSSTRQWDEQLVYARSYLMSNKQKATINHWKLEKCH